GQEEDEILPTDLFLNLISIDLRNCITKLTETDTYAATIYNCIKRKALPPWTTLTDWTLDDGLILFKNKVYVPDNLDLHQSIIAETHELPVAGHPGCFKTLQLLKERFYWPYETKYSSYDSALDANHFSHHPTFSTSDDGLHNRFTH
ncbi:hypothetical protein AX14_011558, partial [Amanita brunnescens Koide BX004]